MADNDLVMIRNVRASFLHVWKPGNFEDGEGKFGAQLMLDPDDHAKDIAAMEKRFTTILKERNKGKKIPSDKYCMRDGDDRGREEFEGLMVISCNNEKQPRVYMPNSKKRIESESDEDPDTSLYSGCYINAKIRLWWQDNKYGKRINAQLVGVQFAAEGDALDGTYVSEDAASEGFGDDEPDDDDDFE